MTEPITAPFSKIAGTIQQNDIAASKGPTDVYNGWGRIKQYVKPDEMHYAAHPRLCEFDQPYQVAAHYGYGTWEECNLAFVAQFAECNLNCPYCFVSDDNTDVVKLAPSDVINGFGKVQQERRKAGVAVPKVLRLSGGEPMLYQNWIVQFLREWPQPRLAQIGGALEQWPGYLWIDTNLTIEPERRLLLWLGIRGRQTVSICGCFKPKAHIPQELYVIKKYVEADISIFLYWPCDRYLPDHFEQTLDFLYEISPGLPLRLQPIKIKWHYEAVKARGVEPPKECAEVIWSRTCNDWARWCNRHYAPAEIWQPSHLVKIE